MIIIFLHLNELFSISSSRITYLRNLFDNLEEEKYEKSAQLGRRGDQKEFRFRWRRLFTLKLRIIQFIQKDWPFNFVFSPFLLRGVLARIRARND